MALSVVWVLMLTLSVLWGAFSGSAAAVGAAALSGAGSAARLCLEAGALLCLWNGVMEILRRSGGASALSALLRPALGRLFPAARRDADTMDALCLNVSANLLGLGNAATPMGLRAAAGLARSAPAGRASDELCLLVVVNTASIQLLPTTVAAVRAQAGAARPFDILPAVWIASALSVGAGLLSARLLSRLWRD